MMMRARAGFTLIEVLVGLTVAALALLAGMVALGFVHDRSVQAAEATRVAVAGATQRALLVEWLTGIRFRAPTGEQFDGAQQLDEHTGEMVDLMLFPTTARTPLGGPVTVVGLYIDHDPDTPERGLVAEMTGMLFGPEPRRMQIAPQAVRMHLRYLAADATGFREWVETWTNRQGMPRVIEMTLEGDSLPDLLRYPIRVALPAQL